ncbi:MAG: PAS domain S-box protein [Bacteroidetes bacterium]|nr:PAS domain S-box protein [Bacteroidota bacterium]
MDKKEMKLSDNEPQNTLFWKEEVFYQVFQSNPTPMAISRFEDAKYVDVNKAFLDFLEYKPEAVINHTSNELQLFLDIIQSDKFLSKLAKLNKVRNFGVKMKTGSGATKKVLFTAETIKIKDEIYLLTIYNDITEKKMIEEKFRATSERYNQMFDNMKDCVAVYEPVDNGNDFIFIEFNKAAEKTEKISKDKLIGKRLLDVFPAAKEFGIFDALKKVYKSGIHVELPVTLYRDDRISGYRKNFVYKLPSNDIVSIYNDVTDQKKSEQELELKSAYLEQIIEEAPEAIALCEKDGKVKTINKEFTKLFGYSNKESIGKQIDDLIAAETRKKEAGEITNIVQKGKKASLETKRKHKEGHEIDVSLLATPIMFDNKQVGLYGIYRDISDRKKAEATEKLAQNISNAVLTTDTLQELFIIIRNEIGARIDTKNFYIALYNEEKDILSLPFFEDEKDSFDDIPAEKTLTAFLIKNKKPLLLKQKEILKLYKEGKIDIVGTPSKVWLGVPLKIENETIGAICLQSYQSEETYSKEEMVILEFIANQIALAINKLRTEEDLKKARQVAEEAAQAKHHFLSIMTHEIRTPLNAILGMTYLLLQEDPKKEQLDFLNSLKFSGDNLMTLINDILDFNKIENGKIFFEEADFNLKELIHGIRQSFRFRAEEKGIKLKVLIDSELPEIVVGDAARLNQVLTNLIGNAIKFTETGSITIDVIVKNTGKKKIELEFSVTDTGIGIPENKQKIVFESFKQASIDTTRKFGGTGLGLAICKQLIKLQGRKLEVESEVGKGSKFFFTLEFKKSERKPWKLEYAGDKEFDQLAGKKVLLAEDNEINIIVARKILTRWGIDVEIVKNGLEAIEKVNKHDFDVILMDLHMPEMNGFEATKIIRKSDHDKIRSIPIIALTASVMSDVQSKIEQSGLNDYILKPFNPSELYNKIFMQVNK